MPGGRFIPGSRLDLLFQLLLFLFQLLDFPVNLIRICETFLRRLSLAVSAYLRCFAIFAFLGTVILSIGMASFRVIKKDFPVAVLVLSYPVQSRRLLPRFFTADVFIPWFGQLTNVFFLSSFLSFLCLFRPLDGLFFPLPSLRSRCRNDHNFLDLAVWHQGIL